MKTVRELITKEREQRLGAIAYDLNREEIWTNDQYNAALDNLLTDFELYGKYK